MFRRVTVVGTCLVESDTDLDQPTLFFIYCQPLLQTTQCKASAASVPGW